jgi:20S proteasome alpha/beta subunit
MHKALFIVMMCATTIAQTAANEVKLESGPVLRGTINVVAANDQGIVVLTDSMLTETWRSPNGVVTSRQRAEPGQKLFQIDDKTVVAFAGFASAATSPVPDFLNNVAAIMGRYEDRMRRIGPISVADKLELLDEIFSHYLKGVANIRDLASSEDDYYFELLIAGYDPDGTPEVGSLVLRMVSEATSAGPFFSPVTYERSIVPVSRQPLVFVHGKRDLALQILRNPGSWRSDPAVAAFQDTLEKGRILTVEQMKSLAISLKQHTANEDKGVGGPNQVAVLTAGRVQSLDQPRFPPVALTDFRFQILATDSFGDMSGPSKPTTYASLAPGFFMLYFRDRFTRVKQILDDGYFSGNIFRECILTFGGRGTKFEKSNQIIDSDLLIGAGVRRDSPEVKQLLKDFTWRNVEFVGDDPKSLKSTK